MPGYQFTPAYKNRLWDGKIRMYDMRSNKMYHGLVPYIEKFCEERNYKLLSNLDSINNSSYNIDKINRNKSITLKRYFIFIKLIKAYNPQISQNSK